jgi:hypothetical protein
MHLRFIALALAAPLFCVPPTLATTMVDVPLDTLIQKADVVVRGRVERMGTRVVLGHAGLEPNTHVWLRVQEQLAGPTIEGLVHIWEPGGSYEGTETSVSGTPNYEVGEDVVVFLRKDEANPGTYRTLEMTQGKFSMMKNSKTGEAMAVRDLSDVSMARWRRNKLELVAPPTQKPITLSNMKARVRALRLDWIQQGAQR